MSNVTVVANTLSNWQIVCPSQQPPLPFAANELRKYIAQISTCELPITEAPAAGPAIVLALREDLPPADRALLPAPADGYDGYAIAIVAEPPRVVIAGDNARGVVYGVYDLLERIGCRWFYPTLDAADPEVVPQLSSVAFPEGKWAMASPFRYRLLNASAMIYEIQPEMAKRQTDAAMKQRYNGMAWQCETKTPLKAQYDRIVDSGLMADIKARGMLLHGPMHCFHEFLKAEDHFEAHPEWFGFREGKRQPHVYGGAQFCWSNPGARLAFIESVEAFLLQCRDIDIFLMCCLDGGKACTCSECTKRNPSDGVLTLMNELAERLAASVPNVILETDGGYPPVEDPPKEVEMHPRLRLMWAHWGRNQTMGYDDPRYDYKWNLDMWRGVAGDRGMTICQYYTDHFAEPWIAAPYAIAMVGDRKYMLEHGVDANYLLEYPEGYWWNCGLNNYMGGVCFYDASTDPFAVVRDYALHYYGEKAGPMMAAYFDEWARNPGLAYAVRGGATDAQRETLARQRRECIDPALQAVASNPTLAHRMGKIEKLHALAERLMATHGRLSGIQELRRNSDFAQAAKVVAAAETLAGETAAYIQRLIDLEQGLIDPQLLVFYFPRLQAAIAEEARAVKAGETGIQSVEKKGPSAEDMLPDDVTS